MLREFDEVCLEPVSPIHHHIFPASTSPYGNAHNFFRGTLSRDTQGLGGRPSIGGLYAEYICCIYVLYRDYSPGIAWGEHGHSTLNP